MKFRSIAIGVAVTLAVVGVSGYQSDTMTYPVMMTEAEMLQVKREAPLIDTTFGIFVRTTEPINAPESEIARNLDLINENTKFIVDPEWGTFKK